MAVRSTASFAALLHCARSQKGRMGERIYLRGVLIQQWNIVCCILLCMKLQIHSMVRMSTCFFFSIYISTPEVARVYLLEILEMTKSSRFSSMYFRTKRMSFFLIFLNNVLSMHKLMQSAEGYMPPYPQELNETHSEEGIGDFELQDQLSLLLTLVLFQSPRKS